MVARLAQKWQCKKDTKKSNTCECVLSIGNRWKKFKTTKELQVRDHVVFIMIVASTFEIEIVDNELIKETK